MTELVSVILPIFNGAKTLDTAVSSIVNQSYGNLEILLIDDGSSDQSLSLAELWAQRDGRIRLLSGPRMGLAAALDYGISLASGSWIARMDQDDFSLPNRIAEQVEFASRFGCDIVGSWAEAFGRPLSGLITNPVTHDEIRIGLAFGSVLVHPSVIIRTNFYRRCQYNKNCFYAEDYEYWTRAIILGGRFGNVPKVLIRYRQHKSQISSKYRHEQLRISKQISINYFYQIRNEIGISISTFLALIGGRESRQLAHDIHTIRSEVEQFALRGEVFATRILLRAMRSFVFYTECEGVSSVSSWWFSLCKTFNVPVSFYDRIILSVVAFSVMVFPNLGPRYIYRLKKYLIG